MEQRRGRHSIDCWRPRNCLIHEGKKHRIDVLCESHDHENARWTRLQGAGNGRKSRVIDESYQETLRCMRQQLGIRKGKQTSDVWRHLKCHRLFMGIGQALVSHWSIFAWTSFLSFNAPGKIFYPVWFPRLGAEHGFHMFFLHIFSLILSFTLFPFVFFSTKVVSALSFVPFSVF